MLYMRVNLLTQSSTPLIPGLKSVPLSLTIRPVYGIGGDYVFPTDSSSLIRMLDLKTDLPSTVLNRFLGDLHSSPSARLLNVELSERVLTDIGYFID